MTDLVANVTARLAAGKPIRRTLPDGGRLHVDRPLPFLCVYRAPAGPDPGTADLVRTQASYVITDDDALVAGVARVLADLCGGCLVVELAAGDDRSRFRIRASDQLATTVEALATALRAIEVAGARLEVELAVEEGPPVDAGILEVALEVPPIYRSATAVYPAVARALAHELAHALQRAFFEFARVQTKLSPSHFHVLGRRRFVRAVRAADAALAAIDASFDFLLAVTPVNTEAAWQEFCASRRTITPTLHYRMLELDPAIGKRQLYQLPLDRLEDPVLAELLRDKRRELDHQLGLLEDRDTPRFLYGSLHLYGEVEDALLAEALAILRDRPPDRSPDRARGARCDARGFAARALDELAHYRREAPALATTITIRDDISSLLVSHGNLLIPSTLDVPAHRVEALLQHELGTHVATYANGRAQPLRVLASGLAGYEALQEGLALFVEYLVGGLDLERLRLIAARVIAVRRVVERVPFPQIVAELVDEHHLAPRSAFAVTLRVVRGGGLTKDAIYLRGLVQLLAHLRAGHELAPLLVGKLALDQLPLIEELLRREVLRPAVVVPRWLAAPGATARLARAAAGIRAIDLPRARP
jgi:uncharacterized protein (TIGR02421 family)